MNAPDNGKRPEAEESTLRGAAQQAAEQTAEKRGCAAASLYAATGGMPEGQAVDLQLEVIPSISKWGEGIRRSAGGWADYPEIEAIMERIHQARKLERRSHIESE